MRVFSLIVAVNWQKLTSSSYDEERFGNIVGVFKVMSIAIRSLEEGEVRIVKSFDPQTTLLLIMELYVLVRTYILRRRFLLILLGMLVFLRNLGTERGKGNIDTVSKFIDLESLSGVTKEEWRQVRHTFKKINTNLVYSEAHIRH
uniref:Uncharacterized protein n=1 Tax=Lactuca sativa TaxID=4236 RepID=A0A9R1VJ30_LACSA|nr:hypothetical protein LSAT_V11C500264640 [Lactuca sativa]